MLPALRRVISATAGATASEIAFTMRAGKHYRLTPTDGAIWYRVTTPNGAAAIVGDASSTQLAQGEGAIVKASGSSTRVSIIRDGASDVAVELVAFGYGVERTVPATTLTVDLVASAASVFATDDLDYTVDVSNTGDVSATDVSVVVTLDPLVDYVSAGGTGWTCSESGGVVTCTRSSLAVGAAPTLTISTTAGSSSGSATTTVVASASNAAEVTDSASVTITAITQDATSGRYVPNDASEWTAFRSTFSLAIANPDFLWLCQEAAGNLADVIGGLTLTANGAPAFQQPAPGWSRTGVKGNALTASQRFKNTSAPNPSTTSMAMFAYVYINSLDASVRSIFGYGAVSDTNVSGYLNGTPSVGRFRYRESANISDTSTANNYVGRVTPILLLTDHTGTRARLYTDLEKISPTYGLPSATAAIFLGADSGTWADSTILYACAWKGANAELFTDANSKAFFGALLGAAVPWS